MCRFWLSSRRGRAAPPPLARRALRTRSHAIMSITARQRHPVAKQQQCDSSQFHDSLNFVTSRRDSELIAEYVSRTARLATNQLFSRMKVAQSTLLAYKSPHNLALELSKSILYEDVNEMDLKTLKSITSHGDSKPFSGDSLWHGKPQQYFESMKYSERSEADAGIEFECDSLAP